ncbi:hypothetical protein SB659_19795, partial [Arthrobacter sp. SIMBA_036]|uniref:hypothetical protein n=1 Tax=Arthrobacter sp. SIMBA_036 TaxID=3085778 RepID=UPI00397E6A36
MTAGTPMPLFPFILQSLPPLSRDAKHLFKILVPAFQFLRSIYEPRMNFMLNKLAGDVISFYLCPTENESGSVSAEE